MYQVPGTLYLYTYITSIFFNENTISWKKIEAMQKKENKNIGTARESNPDRQRGRRAPYPLIH